MKNVSGICADREELSRKTIVSMGGVDTGRRSKVVSVNDRYLLANAPTTKFVSQTRPVYLARSCEPAVLPQIKYDLLRGLLENTSHLVAQMRLRRIFEQYGVKAIPMFSKALADRDARVREGAATWVGEIALLKTCLPQCRKKILSLLMKQLLVDRGSDVRRSIAVAIGKIGDRTKVPLLIGVLQNSKQFVARSGAALALGALKAGQAASVLTKLLRTDGSAVVRGDVATALKEIIGRQAVPLFITSLQKDQSPIVRARVASLLGELRDKRAVSMLTSALKLDKHWSVRSEAASSLGVLGDKRAVPEIIRAVQRDSYERVRADAVDALGSLRDPTAVTVLMRVVLKDTSYVRWRAVHALGDIADRRAIPVLRIVAQKDKDETIRRAARYYLRNVFK